MKTVFNIINFHFPWASQVVSVVAQEMYETQVRSLGREDSLEEGMATHSSILAWRIPWSEDPGGLQSLVLQSWTCCATEHMINQKMKDHINAPTVFGCALSQHQAPL